MDLLDSLNPSQRAAVEDYEGASLVIAGAGSGKTRVLTYRIAYMLSKGVKPWNILALTFTNKAAGEMRERIEKLVNKESADRLWMGTFHSIFSRILRREADVLGIKRDFTIYDASDSKSLLKTIVKEMGLDEKTYKPNVVCGRISRAKNALITPERYCQDSRRVQNDQAARVPQVHEIYRRYAQRCRLANALDFDDLLLFTYQLFFDHPDVCAKYEKQFEYVLVDEYQDTNFAQSQIVWLLTQHNQRLCAVGDDAQSIYSFRGANIDHILRFTGQYPAAKLHKLERNYRSTQMIVKAAGSLIEHNRDQIEKNLYSENALGEPVLILSLASDLEEAGNVAKRMERLHAYDHVAYHDMAVLYRTNIQSRQIEEALRRESIPYIIYGGTSFYQRKEIKDTLAYLRLAVNSGDEEAFRRVVNTPTRGIGNTTLQKVFDCATARGVRPIDVVADPENYGIAVNKATANRLMAFAHMIEAFGRETDSLDAETLTREILIKSGLAADINKGSEPEDISRQENLQEFLNALAAFGEERKEQGLPCLLTDFLQEVSLMTDFDEQDSDGDTVSLMTIHASKGLEFKVVFVVGVEEGLFPSQMAIDENPRGLEEERRLMYVAMTRASERLVLSSCQNRFRHGQCDMAEPSRFLREIDPRFVKREGRTPMSHRPQYGDAGRTNTPSSRFAPVRKFPTQYENRKPVLPSRGTSGVTLTAGMRVEHARFGQGVVLSVEGEGIDMKARVKFDTEGEKMLLLSYARIKVIK